MCGDHLSPGPHRHHLCRSRHYCHDLGRGVGSLYAQVERLVQQASRQADASVSLYHFNAALYLLRVLKGNAADAGVGKTPKKQKAGPKPKGPEVSGPWPGKARPLGAQQGCGPGPPARFMEGGGGRDSRDPALGPRRAAPALPHCPLPGITWALSRRRLPAAWI